MNHAERLREVATELAALYTGNPANDASRDCLGKVFDAMQPRAHTLAVEAIQQGFRFSKSRYFVTDNTARIFMNAAVRVIHAPC